MFKVKNIPMILNLFDSGSSAGGSGADGSAADSGANGDSGNSGNAAENKPTVSDELWDKVGGRPKEFSIESTGNAGQENGNNNSGNATLQTDEETLQSEFDSLIGKGGKYEKLYKSKIGAEVKRRNKGLQRQYDELSQQSSIKDNIIDVIGRAYGGDKTDLNAILTAVQNDDYFYMNQANDNGMSVEEYRETLARNKEIEDLRKENERLLARQKSSEQNARIDSQVEEVQKKFPDFDIDSEVNNPKFLTYLAMRKDENGVIADGAIEEAYKFAHMDELQDQIIKASAQAENKRLSEQAIANQFLPNINGTNGTASQSNLSLSDIEEIARQVAKGDTSGLARLRR